MLNFNEIYKAENQNVINYINWKLNNICDAEDVAVNVFEKVSKHLKNFDPEKSSLASWLRTITNRCIIDFYRSDHTRHFVYLEIDGDANVIDKDKKHRYSTGHFTNVSNIVNEEGSETFQFVGSPNNEANYKLENQELHLRIRKAVRSLKPQYKKIAILYFIQDKPYNEIAELCEIPMGTVKGMISRVREKLQAELKGLYNVRKSNVQIEEEEIA